MALLWSLLGFFSLVRGFLPQELTEMLEKWWNALLRPANYSYFHIPDDGISGVTNDLYRVVQLYLIAANLCSAADELVLSRDENEEGITYNLAGDEIVVDTFEGVKVWWTHSTKKVGKDDEQREDNKYTLKMYRKNKDFVMNSYLPHVIANAMEHKRQVQELFLFSNRSHRWDCHTFKHPSTFDTLAMDPCVKSRVKSDLQAFMAGQTFFHKVGRAWKRGYLLYGPPGTGKSSMIAAMANYLKYNIYDLELTQVEDNSTLKDLLVNTTSKSIIVIEDIDCSLELSGQRTQQVPSPGENPKAPLESRVTLSGLLNFTDGLWSCCGDERIIIFTTNHFEKLDPALLRPGRMDMHIHMSYCCFETFKVLSANYLSVNSHPLYSSVQSLLEGGVLITPAQVTEFLFGNKDDPDVALEKLISHMKEIAQEDAKKTGKDAELKAVDVLMKENVEKDLKENREEPRKETPESVNEHVDQGKEGKMENGWDVKKENVDILKEIVDTLKENGVSLDKMVDAFAKALPESTFCKQNRLAMALQV
ncbi:unnamed protein product [Sphagnum jensenii]|uniref:AAA+ ATPase domain-containing protein n=1 Tax=Sphagnum jensenii TaxID=128206 RepID=A0ABP0VTQ3_9BRYO